MVRLHSGLCVAILLVATAPAFGGGVEGNWKLTYLAGGVVEQTPAIVKVQVRDGKATGELVAGNTRLPNLLLKNVALENGVLRIVVQSLAFEMGFEVAVPVSEAARINGVMVTETAVMPAWLTKTDQTALDLKDSSRLLDCPPLQKSRTLSQKAQALRFKAQQTKDPEQRAALLKQASEADAVAREQVPGLYREVLAKHGDSPAVFEAALSLIRTAKAQEYKLEEVKAWSAAAVKLAKDFGPRWHSEFAGQVAGALVNQEPYVSLTVEYARQAERAMSPKAPPGDQVRVLTTLTKALRKSGQAAEATSFDTRLAKLEVELDREYLAKMPPFKGSPFAGRKGKSDRAVFFELFTGATCPPCVAADLAFDVLTKNYKADDLVLIQYHIHIPGPDPMTNPDTEARWKYYSTAFPTQIRGVPSSVFNGKPTAGGGGGVANAEKKYEVYRDVIDPLLEEPAGAKLTAHAHRKGNRIDIAVEVNNLTGPDPLKKLRILLAEETIRYSGSNKIRFHHNVVRAFSGGVEGQPLMAVSSKHTASIDLDVLRGQLTKYLDEYEANKRPFANPARPLDFANLRVIAFVQDDNTHEILQAVQVEVHGAKNGK